MLHDDYDPKYVRLCNVEWFNVEIDPTNVTVGQLRALSNKVVEEAAEAMIEGKNCIVYADKKRLKEELADTIQACCNLAAAFGIFDLREAIDDCRDRNTERGRISKRITERQEEVIEFLSRYKGLVEELEDSSDSKCTSTEDGV